MAPVLAFFQVLLSIGLCALILLHSGRDTGLGGMGFTPASQGGTHIVERNLTRVTIVIAILFTANTIALFHALPSLRCWWPSRPRAAGGRRSPPGSYPSRAGR